MSDRVEKIRKILGAEAGGKSPKELADILIAKTKEANRAPQATCLYDECMGSEVNLDLVEFDEEEGDLDL